MYLDFVKKGSKICLCVSGGVDSMVMLYRFVELKKTIEFDLSVININHNIRDESCSDSVFVINQCKLLNVKAKSISIDCLNFCQENKVSIESGARLLRYNVFNEISLDVDYMCLAHHLDDQAETILMHIMRGSGSKGAEGMSYINGKYVRPLLDTTKAEVLAYADKYNIPFVVDKTNFDNDYNRNYVRNIILPAMKKVYPSCNTSLAKFGSAVKEDNDFLNSLVNESGLIIFDNEVTVPFTLFSQPLPLVKRLLFKVLNMCGAKTDIEKKHIDIIINFQQKCDSGKMLSLPFDISVIKSYNELIFTTKAIEPKKDTVKPFKLGKTVFEDVVLNVDNLGNGLKFDIEKLPDGCVFRHRKDGDIFKKFGSGSKKLKEYLIDKKIPFSKRDNLILLACENEVYLIVNIEISDKIKIDQSTKQIFYLHKGDIDKNENPQRY